MNEMIDFLAARTDEAFDLAQRASGPVWRWRLLNGDYQVLDATDDEPVAVHFAVDVDPEHVVAWDPANVMVLCRSVRAIIDETRRAVDYPVTLPEDMQIVGAQRALLGVVQVLVQQYKNHPDFKQEWSMW